MVGCRLCCRFAARFSATSSAQRGVLQGLEYLGVTSSFVCLKQMALVSVIFVTNLRHESLIFLLLTMYLSNGEAVLTSGSNFHFRISILV